MSIFGSIMGKIFGTKTADAAPVAAVSSGEQPTADAPAGAGGAPVDVAAVLDGMLATSGGNLNWRQSIVDLMKLLGLDSSLGARKELADELGFDGDTNDSASMNIWLHKQVMQKLADNGGQVPADLKS